MLISGKRILQPFVDQDSRTSAVFNGEIYNWRSLNVYAESDGEVGRCLCSHSHPVLIEVATFLQKRELHVRWVCLVELLSSSKVVGALPSSVMELTTLLVFGAS